MNKRIYNFFTTKQKNIKQEFGIINKENNYNDKLNFIQAKEIANLLRAKGVSVEISKEEEKEILNYVSYRKEN